MRNKKWLTLSVISLLIICILMSGCEKEPEKIAPREIKAEASKVLLAGKKEVLEVPIKISPADSYPLDFVIQTSDKEVANATIGAIGNDGKVVTASDQQKKKQEADNKEDADKIVVPTNTAVVTAEDFGECDITISLGELSDSFNVVVADKQIALTFDDGACPETFDLLKGLRKENVKATFFVVGSMTNADNHIEALKEAIKDGHEIGNHTYNHKAGAATLKEELAKTDKIIEKAGGEKTTLMRPPGGSINSATKKCGKSIVMWSVDTMDWKYKVPNEVRDRIFEAKDGDIVLLHDLHKTSVQGALKAIPKLKKKGFYMVTTTELLGDPKPNTEYRNKKTKIKSKILEK